MTPPPRLLEPTPHWTADETPTLPGSAASIDHSTPIRLAYFAIGIMLGITGGLGNGLVGINLPQIQGHLGLTPVEGAWLSSAYLMTNISSNLVLFKFRQQFGLRRFAEIGLSLYALFMLLHVFVDSFAMALVVRAVSGFAAASASTLAIFYVLQAFPKAKLGQALVIGIGIAQLATPLGWLLSPALLDLGEWRTLYLFESGLALCSLAAVVVLKLPPGMRIAVYEKLDFVTFALLAPALALIAGVLTQGRVQWWTAQPWMAWALLAAIVLVTIAAFIEHHRTNPLIQTRWLGTLSTIRFAMAAIGIRFLLSEQTYAATGFLRALGMGPDQLRPLYAVILAGLTTGIVLGAATFGPKAIVPQISGSVILIIVASFLDWNATSLTRPHDMFVSQFLISVAATLFMGPLLLAGIMPVLKLGSDHVVSFAVLFSLCQSFGGLAGPAILGTIQQFRQHEYSAVITAGVDPTAGVVAQRLAMQGQVYAGVITDPALRQAQGVGQLAQAATREANVRGFDDIFLLSGLLALAFLGWSLVHVVRLAIAARNAPPPEAGTASGAAAF